MAIANQIKKISIEGKDITHLVTSILSKLDIRLPNHITIELIGVVEAHEGELNIISCHAVKTATTDGAFRNKFQ